MRPLRSSVALLAIALAACDDVPRRVTAAGEPSRVVLTPVCVTFDPFAGLAGGGAAGNSPGDLFFTENGIPVTLHTFVHLPGFGTAFGDAAVVDSFPFFGDDQIGHTANINLGFTFTSAALGFTPASVTFKWRDHGGHENLKVNNSAIHVGELTASPTPMGGAAVSHNVTFTAPMGAFKLGNTTITGAVGTLGVGGQEFHIENVCANP
ncbi:MAG TPA: hypothetical protein VF006_07790 [Longimicrobium sp.]